MGVSTCTGVSVDHQCENLIRTAVEGDGLVVAKQFANERCRAFVFVSVYRTQLHYKGSYIRVNDTAPLLLSDKGQREKERNRHL